MCPTDLYVLHELGVCSYELGNFNVALDWWTRGLSIAKEFVTRAPERIRFIRLFHIGLGHGYRKHKRWNESIVSFQNAIKLSNPSDGDSLDSASSSGADAYTGLGYVYHAQGNLSTAINQYLKSLALDPANTIVQDFLDMAHMDVFTRDRL